MCGGGGGFSGLLKTAATAAAAYFTGGVGAAALSAGASLLSNSNSGNAPAPQVIMPQLPAQTTTQAPQSQAAKQPDQAAQRAQTITAAGRRAAQATQVTGPQGISNSLLALGKNTLLGN